MIDALPLLLGPEGYQISRSVRLRSSASAYFNRTPGSAGNRKTWTWSGWVKRGALAGQDLFNAYQDANNQTLIAFSSDTLIVYTIHGGGAFDYGFQTTAVFRDPSAWYHIVVVFDSANATAANRAAVYVNGVSQAGSMAFGDIPLNQDGIVNSTNAHSIGRRGGGSQYFDGYLTEINFIDGQALTPASFGETDQVTGVWQPKKYTGTYGTNGFYLNFSDNSAATAAAIGKDSSGNGNNWTPNNISVTAGVTYDSMLDVPTQWADGGNGRGNYAVLNPLSGPAVPSTITNGNLTATTASSAFSLTSASMAMQSGKWYCEIKFSSLAIGAFIGIRNSAESTSSYVGGTSGSYGYYSSNGNKYNAGSSSAYGSSYTTAQTIGIAFDADAGTLTFYRDNVSQGVAYSSIPAADYVFALSDEGTGSVTCDVNFGQRPFSYTPPSGFKALNTLNLPTPTILKGNQYFDATTYTGTGASLAVTNSGGFQPDFVWIKNRSTTNWHQLYDSVRGVQKALYSNATDAEATETQGLLSFNTNGMTVGTNAGINGSGNSIVGWQWKEGPTQGFDIVTYTGDGSTQNISHNLGVAPRMMIVKSRSTAQRWTVYHASVSNSYIYLNETFAAETANAALRFGNNSAVVQPTSSVFTIGNSVDVNQNTTTYVAYLFSEVAGFSRIGSYTGNNSTDGPFVFCGFRPKFVMIKAVNNTYDWEIADSSRSPDNYVDDYLVPNSSAAENANVGAANSIDFLSNGFKIRANWTRLNESNPYIFIAFAEVPYKNSLAR
jgi:hypothetical protein